MTAVLDARGSVELAVLERSGMVESRHVGVAVVLDPGKRVARALGDVNALVYPRSCLKLAQAVAMQRAGAALEGVELVLASASHAGRPEHVAVVRSILDRAGLDESALRCPADWPLDPSSRRALSTSGSGPIPITMNCSGKHAAFLLTCVRNGWTTVDYLDPEHPLQVHIRSVVSELSGSPIAHSGVDGCGAPVHAITLTGLARAVSDIVGGADEHGTVLARAIRAHPWAIDGPGRANTVAIERLGVVAKLGAEGVTVVAAPDGTTVALKILDGSLRAATLVALELLVAAGAIDADGAADVVTATTERVLGGGVDVGAIRPSALVAR